MSNYLVTGATGQLGRCFQKVAEEFPNHKLIFTNQNEVDITQPETLEKFYKIKPFNGIINCAAFSQVDEAEVNSEKAYKINTDGLRYLIQPVI